MEEYEFERLKLGHRGSERQAPNCTKKRHDVFFLMMQNMKRDDVTLAVRFSDREILNGIS